MLHGGASVETLIPGNVSQIQGAVENLGSGVTTARDIAEAWGSFQLPGWVGKAATGFRAVVPREASRVGLAPGALNQAAVALLAYQSAFLQARAEAQAAIQDALLAEQASSQARTNYQTAVQNAATADPDTPESVVPPFHDPGQAMMVAAQTRLTNAQTVLNLAGNTAAGVIRAAANTTTGDTGEIDWWEMIPVGPIQWIPGMREPVGDFLEGFLPEVWGDIVGLAELLNPVKPVMDVFDSLKLLATEGIPGVIEHENAKWDALVEGWGPFWEHFVAADLWGKNNAQAVGRVTWNFGSLFIGVGGVAKLGKAAKAAKAAKTVDPHLPTLPKSAPRQLGRGPSHGRIAPRNLTEQLAMTQARSNPAAGKVLPLPLKDPRWPASKGWVKMQQIINGVKIHYVWNTKTGKIDDFKFPIE